jgi:NmrA-like family
MGTCQKMGVQHIIFLSVQGVENSSIIPHHKIEKLIVESKISYTFLRPAYFMQNFTTTLHHDLIEKKQIFLPAGEAKFTLIDVRDIGEVTARILADLTPHINKSYELTSEKALSFAEMTDIINSRLGTKITYKSPNLIHFFFTKKREHISTGFILVLIMLHYLPRFQSTPKITDWVEKITHQKPTTFEKFVDDNRQLLTL